MNNRLKLTILKRDLQLLTDSQDEYLKTLLKLAKEAIIREGIVFKENDKSIELGMAVVNYAAYLYRKRASSETAMPRYLRYELNNILFSQKARKKAIEDDS